MMDAFRVWLMGLMAVALILTVLSSVLPEGSVKKIAGVTGGLVLLMVILQGAERLDLGKLQLSYDDYSRQINEQIKAFQEKNSRDMDLLIQERCSAYISEQAQTFGLVCSPQVETEQTEEGVFVPVSVTMDIPYHAGLSQIVAEDMGIDAQHQKWLTSEG